jgi:hypothetical protein
MPRRWRSGLQMERLLARRGRKGRTKGRRKAHRKAQDAVDDEEVDEQVDSEEGNSRHEGPSKQCKGSSLVKKSTAKGKENVAAKAVKTKRKPSNRAARSQIPPSWPIISDSDEE